MPRSSCCMTWLCCMMGYGHCTAYRRGQGDQMARCDGKTCALFAVNHVEGLSSWCHSAFSHYKVALLSESVCICIHLCLFAFLSQIKFQNMCFDCQNVTTKHTLPVHATCTDNVHFLFHFFSFCLTVSLSITLDFVLCTLAYPALPFTPSLRVFLFPLSCTL